VGTTGTNAAQQFEYARDAVAGHVCDGCEDGACGSDRHLRMDKGRALPQALQGNAGIDSPLEAEVRSTHAHCSARLQLANEYGRACGRQRTR